MTDVKKTTGVIWNYSEWDDTINMYVKRFYEQHNVYPNILIASDITHNKINNCALKHPERIVCLDETFIDTPSIKSFEGKDYILDFCVDNKLEENLFMLVFDANPEFEDGEPIPEEIEETQHYYRRCA